VVYWVDIEVKSCTCPHFRNRTPTEGCKHYEAALKGLDRVGPNARSYKMERMSVDGNHEEVGILNVQRCKKVNPNNIKKNVRLV